jgi:hypothetical protein
MHDISSENVLWMAGFRRLITSSSHARAITVFSTGVLIGHSGGRGASPWAGLGERQYERKPKQRNED